MNDKSQTTINKVRCKIFDIRSTTFEVQTRNQKIKEKKGINDRD